MSERRQESRRAQQERRRQERRNRRIEQRRTPGVAGAPAVAGAGTATRPARVTPTAQRRRGIRPVWIAAGVIGGLAAVALIIFLLRAQAAPLPGQHFDTNGNQHVEPGEAHGAYFSNPPTSGWHYGELPKAGEYATPVEPEAVGHFMEHGGVWVLYTCPNGCDDLVGQLREVMVREVDNRRRPVALAPYPPKDRTPPEKRINVIAWQYLLALDDFDRNQIEDFIERQACRYNPEGGPYCQGTKGSAKDPTKDAGASGFNARTATPAPAALPAATAPAGPTAVGPTPVPTATP